MRSLLRSVMAGALLASVALGAGAGTTLAASGGPASTTTYSIDDAWCFDDVVQVYCFDIDGTLHITINANGEMLAMNARQSTIVYQGGVVVGESRQITVDQFRYSEDGRFVMQSVVHTRAQFGGQTCVSTLGFRIADYEIVFDHAIAPHCN